MPLTVQIIEGRSFSKTVTLEGQLNNETVSVLDVALEEIVASRAKVVVFDLADLDYISSVGLRSIFRLQKVMAARSGATVLLTPQPAVKKVLEIANAFDLGAIFHSMEDLDHFLDAVQRDTGD